MSSSRGDSSLIGTPVLSPGEPAPKRARTATPQSQEMTAHVDTLDPEGDVVLILKPNEGSEGGQEFAYLVNSTVLSMASPVFKAMFCPSFKEGAQIKEGIRPNITLREDHVDAMAFLLRYFHCLYLESRRLGLPKGMCLGAIAAQIDNYDLSPRISHIAQRWLAQEAADPNTKLEGLLRLACSLNSRWKPPSTVIAKIINEATPSQWVQWHRSASNLPEVVIERASLHADKIRAEMVDRIYKTTVEIYNGEGAATPSAHCKHCGITVDIPSGHIEHCKKCPAPNLVAHAMPSCNARSRRETLNTTLKRIKLYPVSEAARNASPKMIVAALEKRWSSLGCRCSCQIDDCSAKCPLINGLANLETDLKAILAKSDSFDMFKQRELQR